MSDASQSKRERQKQRREAKVAQERAAAARSRRNRTIALGLVVLLVLTGLGAVVLNRVQERQAEADRAELAAATLDEVGCTPVEEQPDQGAGHIGTDAASLAAAGPDQLYPDRPATSGQHLPTWIISGAYEKQIDERLLVHNLEHGYVNFLYRPDAPQETVDALLAFVRSGIEGDTPKLIAAPYDQPLPGDATFAITAWNSRQVCRDFDEAVAQSFVDRYHGGEAAPERFLDPHLTPEEGIDPGATEGPLLFPPLGEFSTSGEETMAPATEAPATEAPATEAPATEGAS